VKAYRNSQEFTDIRLMGTRADNSSLQSFYMVFLPSGIFEVYPHISTIRVYANIPLSKKTIQNDYKTHYFTLVPL